MVQGHYPSLEASDPENKWTMEGQWAMKGLLAKAAHLGRQTSTLAAASVELIPVRAEAIMQIL